MAVKTWDTSRAGGGTYELERDATTGNYSLKSVGFTQVNKLNLPDLLSQDATTTTTQNTNTTQTTGTTDTSQPYKQLAKAQLGDDTKPDYSGVMLKTPKVKDISVRDAGANIDVGYWEKQDKPGGGKWTKDEILADKTGMFTDESSGNDPQDALDPDPNNYGFDYSGNFIGEGEGPRATQYSDDLYETGEHWKDTSGQVGIKGVETTTGLQKIKPDVKKVTQKAKFKLQPIIGIAGKALGGFLKSITPESSPTQKVNKALFNVRGGSVDGNRIAGNPAEDLYAGMNRTSAFGNLERAGNKRINTRNSAKTQARLDKLPPERKAAFNAKTKEMQKQAAEYKQKKEEGGGGDDQGSDSNTRVICTELHRTKEMSTVDWIRDIRFTYKNLSKDHIKGYLFWAVPTVKHIQKYPTYRKIWKHLAQHRANDIAWRLNQGKFDLLGRIYAGIGEPLCWLIGKCVSDKQLKELKLNSWRRA